MTKEEKLLTIECVTKYIFYLRNRNLQGLPSYELCQKISNDLNAEVKDMELAESLEKELEVVDG